jgi:hypothetical protein
VKVILKVSHNLHAEMLPEIIGPVLGKAGTAGPAYPIHDLSRSRDRRRTE